MLAIKVKNLVKKYNGQLVLDHINLDIKEGEFYCLMGPNGSGKTTLSAIIASIRAANSGTVKIFGQFPQNAKKLFGYIPQQNFSDISLTGEENLFYFAKLLGYKKQEAKNLVKNLLDKVGLSSDAKKRVSKYSGGMRKKLELATILFPKIKLLILDEPTTGLDPSARRNFFSLIDQIKESDVTIFLISHIGSNAELASRVGFISNGKIIAEGTPEKLKNKSGLKNIITVEASLKNKEIEEILNSYNKGDKILETDKGYKIFSDETAEVIPKIVRSVESKNYKVIEIGSVIPSLEDVFFKYTGKNIRENEK